MELINKKIDVVNNKLEISSLPDVNDEKFTDSILLEMITLISK